MALHMKTTGGDYHSENVVQGCQTHGKWTGPVQS